MIDEPKMDILFSSPSGKVAKPFNGGVNYASDVLDRATVKNMVDMLQVRPYASRIDEAQAFVSMQQVLQTQALQATHAFLRPCHMLLPISNKGALWLTEHTGRHSVVTSQRKHSACALCQRGTACAIEQGTVGRTET